MAFKDFFKSKKEPEKKRKDVSSKVLVKEKKKEASKETVKPIKKARKKIDEGDAYRVLKAPHITEKTTRLAKSHRYVFKVYEEANKPRIKKAIEKIYNVDVLSVKIIKIGPKKVIFKGIKGQRKGYKKAVIEIKKGQKIEIFSR